MKLLNFFLLTVMIVPLAVGQSFVDKYFQNLLDADHSTVIHVSGDMFQYAAVVVDDDAGDGVNTKEVLNGIKSVKFVSVDQEFNSQVEYQKAIRTIGKGMSELASIKSKEGRMNLFIDERHDVVYEIVATGYNEEDFFVASVLCEIKLSDLDQVIGKIKEQDWKAVRKVSDVEVADLNVYPNPVSSGTTAKIQIPASMIGGRALLIDGTGRTALQFEVTSENHKLEGSQLVPGNYILSIVKDDTQLKKKIFVVE